MQCLVYKSKYMTTTVDLCTGFVLNERSKAII